MSRLSFIGIRKAIAVSFIGAAIAGLAFGAKVPTVAHAATTGTCEFEGATTQLDPMPMTGSSSGGFKFHGSAICVVNGVLFNTTEDVSDGHYDDLGCLTGTATGTLQFGNGFSPIGFSIAYVYGQGTLTATSGGIGGGPVDITPSNSGACVVTPVLGLNVNAVFSGTQ